MRFLQSLERPALLISQMFLPEEVDRMAQLMVTASGWRLVDLMLRGGTRRAYFLSLAQELVGDRALATEFVRRAAVERPRRAADVRLLGELLAAHCQDCGAPFSLGWTGVCAKCDVRRVERERLDSLGVTPAAPAPAPISQDDDADGIRGDAAGDPLADVHQPGNTESYNFGRLMAKLDAPRAVCVDLVLSAAWWALRDLGDPALTAAMGRMVLRYRGPRGAIIVGGEDW